MNRFLHLARVVLEADTALSIGARKGGERDDLQLVVDAMGLPTIPASGLAGALRAMAREHYGDAFAKAVFGHLSSTGGQRSRLVVSWGVCHGDDDLPMEAIPAEADGSRWASPLVTRLRQLADVPIKRDRVALDHRATSIAQRKFDRSVVPKGTRFTIELRLWSAEPAEQDWQRLTGLLMAPGLRLGGATRSGLGKLRVQRTVGRAFDLANPPDAEAFRALPVRFDRPTALPALNLRPAEGHADTELRCTLTLRPEGFLRIGQGDTPFLRTKDEKNVNVLAQKSEPEVSWAGGKGAITASARPLIPASSVKGALSDRVAFHAHRHAGRFVDNARDATAGWLPSHRGASLPEALAAYDKSMDCLEVQALFGVVGGHEGACAGRIVIDDAWLTSPDERQAMRVTHNVIDRFTGGVREHLLFTEEVLFKPALQLELRVRQPASLSAAARDALREALQDLLDGLLPLGAASTRGNGFFFGEAVWSDGGRWINGVGE
jgi:CRISPR/Cas system CSM-associated protein Csm3 (group 7 of RAMP superfamily)